MKRNVIGVACAVVVFVTLVMIFGTVGRESNAPMSFIMEAVDAIGFLIAWSCDLPKRAIQTLAMAALLMPAAIAFFVARALAGMVIRKRNKTQ